MTDWINFSDRPPKHMQQVRVFYENPFFGSAEREKNAVFLWFKGYPKGSFYDSEEQVHLDYITKWRPLPEPSEGAK